MSIRFSTVLNLTDVADADQLDPSVIHKSLDSSGRCVVEDGENNFAGRKEESDAIPTQVSKGFMCSANAIYTSQCLVHVSITRFG
jgi:hypothetical protein